MDHGQHQYHIINDFIDEAIVLVWRQFAGARYLSRMADQWKIGKMYDGVSK